MHSGYYTFQQQHNSRQYDIISRKKDIKGQEVEAGDVIQFIFVELFFLKRLRGFLWPFKKVLWRHMLYMLCAVRPEIMCPKLFGNFPEYALARELEWFDLFHKCSITVYTLTKQYILCGRKHLTILPDFIFEQ